MASADRASETIKALILRPLSQPLGDDAIVVRLPADLDIDALIRYGDDPEVEETIWVPIPTPCSRAQAAKRLDEFKRGWQNESHDGPGLVIAEADTNEMIGVIFLSVHELDSVELSYGVAAAHRNHGVASTAGRSSPSGASRNSARPGSSCESASTTSPPSALPSRPDSRMKESCTAT